MYLPFLQWPDTEISAFLFVCISLVFTERRLYRVGESILTYEWQDATATALLSFEKDIKADGLSVFQVGDRILFEMPVSEENKRTMQQAIEKHAFDLDLDFAKVRLFYLDKENGILKESQMFIQKFVEEQELTDTEGCIPISLLPELFDFTLEKLELVETENNALFGTSDVSYAEMDEKTPPAIDAISPPSEIEVTNNLETPHKHIQKSQSKLAEDSIEGRNKEETADNRTNDIWMEKARTLFEANQHIRLPAFDELTHKELQEQVLQAQFVVSEAKDASILEIYHRLKAEKNQSEEQIEAHVLKHARQVHDETLQRIERNLKTEMQKLLADREATYEQDREAYIEKRIPVIRREYDATHYGDHQQVLEAEMSSLRKRSQEEAAEENARFNAYIQQVFEESKETIVETISMEDIMETYNKIAEEQKEVLKIQANSLKGQLGSTITDIVNERDRLKEEIARYEAEIEAQKQKEQSTIEQSVSVAIAEKEQLLLEANKAQLDESYSREQDLIRQIDLLENSLASEKASKELLQREYINPAENTAREEPKGRLKNMFQGDSYKISPLIWIVSACVGVLILCLLGGILYEMYGLKQEVASGNNVQQSMYLEQLQTDKRYKKTAEEMKLLGFSDKKIAEMYLDNGEYMTALKKDTGVLNDFYTFVISSPEDKQQAMLEEVKAGKMLNEKQLKGLDARLAMLQKDSKALATLLKDTDALTAKAAVAYFIDQKAYDDADKLLKRFPNEKQYEQMKQEKKVNDTEQVAKTKLEIEALKQQIQNAAVKETNLKKDIASLQKSKDTAKAVKIKAKAQDITNNAKQKATLEASLKEKQTQLADLEKELS